MQEGKLFIKHETWSRVLVSAVCLLGLLCVYWLQAGWLNLTTQLKPYVGSLGSFLLNRLLRLLLNDLFMLGLFAAIFNRSAEVRIGTLVAFFELIFLLPAYIVLKFALEGDIEISNPLLSFVHRLIVNPLLMIILLFSLVYQRYLVSRAH